MKVRARLNNLRVSPRKVRLVADLVRGFDIEKARAQLRFSDKGVAKDLLQLLNSAIANAKNNFDLDEKSLKIVEIRVDEGRTLKRWRPRAQGSAAEILKRSSKVMLVLEGKKEVGKKKAKKVDSKK